jgi:hypothetical protein
VLRISLLKESKQTNKDEKLSGDGVLGKKAI